MGRICGHEGIPDNTVHQPIAFGQTFTSKTGCQEETIQENKNKEKRGIKLNIHAVTVATHRAGFKQIGPIAPNLVPCLRGPRARVISANLD